MKFIVPVLAVFLCTSCLPSAKKKGFSTDINDKTTYDIPPIAPIPPERFCFEQDAAHGAKNTAEVFIVGDSAYGKIDYSKNTALNSGEFKGIIYGSTLIISYKFKTDSGLITQEQKWKFAKDSLYRIYVGSTADSSSAVKDSIIQANFTGIMRKTACR